MPENVYEYAVIRLVPRVERGEFINVGVVLYCPGSAFLDMRYMLDPVRIRAVCRDETDIPGLEEYLKAHRGICLGTATQSPIATLPMQERFRWLAATRSTVIQLSPVHIGYCRDPETTLRHLMQQQVE